MDGNGTPQAAAHRDKQKSSNHKGFDAGGDKLRASYIQDVKQATYFAKKSAGGSGPTKALKSNNQLLVEEKNERVETARFDFFLFKQTIYDLFDELRGEHSRIGSKKLAKNNLVLDKIVLEKLCDAEQKLEKLDQHFEYLASAAEKSEMLTQANLTQKKEKKVLARSLKEIDFTY